MVGEQETKDTNNVVLSRKALPVLCLLHPMCHPREEANAGI